MQHDNQTVPVTDEELDQMIWKLERDGGMVPKMLSLMKELREVRKSKREPVAYLVCNGRLYQDRPLLSFSSAQISVKDRNDGAEIKPLYTAPPAPVVPDEKPTPNTLKMYAVDAVAAIAEVRGWNACRAAMCATEQEPVQSVDHVDEESLHAIKAVSALVSSPKNAASRCGKIAPKAVK